VNEACMGRVANTSASKSARHERIDSILAGAVTPESQLAAWYRHLHSNLRFPFTVTYGPSRGVAPFCGGAILEVFGLAPFEQSNRGVCAKVRDGQKSVALPLESLTPRDADLASTEAINDWQYWRSSNAQLPPPGGNA
jgi:hypothetical protein